MPKPCFAGLSSKTPNHGYTYHDGDLAGDVGTVQIQGNKTDYFRERLKVGQKIKGHYRVTVPKPSSAGLSSKTPNHGYTYHDGDSAGDVGTFRSGQ